MKRPWKVSWSWSQVEQFGASYASEGRAMERARREADAGSYDVRVWQVNENGYLVGRVRSVEPLPTLTGTNR